MRLPKGQLNIPEKKKMINNRAIGKTGKSLISEAAGEVASSEGVISPTTNPHFFRRSLTHLGI